jgi:hypothetical protein
MREAQTTFTREEPHGASPLLADLAHVPERRFRRRQSHTLLVAPTAPRKGLLRRPQPVPGASVFRGTDGFHVIVGTLDVLRPGSLASDLDQAGFTPPERWTLKVDVSNSAGWLVPLDEPADTLLRAVVDALRAIPGGTASSYTARLEHDDGRRREHRFL